MSSYDYLNEEARGSTRGGGRLNRRHLESAEDPYYDAIDNIGRGASIASREDDFLRQPSQPPPDQDSIHEPAFGAGPAGGDGLSGRVRSDSEESGFSRDSLGNRRRKSGALLRTIQGIEGQEGHMGGIAHHRQPRVRGKQAQMSESSGSWGLSSSSSSGESAGAQRPGFRNGSWNPFKWNWRSLFRRGR
jgi:hypothetical protein